MKTIKLFLFISMFFITAYLPVYSNAGRYDELLAKMDKVVENIDTEDRDKEPYKKWSLTFEHEQFPELNGTWLLTKKTNKRITKTVPTKPITFIHCNSRLPFEKRDFKDKEVIINSKGPDFYQVNAKSPVSEDVYFDPNKNKNFTYQNFGFKAVLDPQDISYAYALKLHNPIENPALSRQLWLNGRLKFELVSHNRIVAKGYEMEYTPECEGYIMDEIEFVFVKV